MAGDAAHLLIATALALGFALLVLSGGKTAVRVVAAQGVAVGVALGVAAGVAAGAAAMTGGEPIPLGIAALLLLAGNGAGLKLLAAPAQRRAGVVPAVAAAALAMLLVLALPREAVAGLPVRRDDLALALATALAGAVVAARGDPAWQALGLLALANGAALVGLTVGDPPVALAATLFGLLVAGVASRAA